MMQFTNRLLKTTLMLLVVVYGVDAQSKTDSLVPGSRVTVIPGSEYQAGGLHRLFFGDHWRSLWTSPIEVQVLDLGTFAGGLTPIKRGGGFQTKSLHFKGNDGKFYKFRSINKDPEKVLPRELRDTFVADIVQDQISTSHPLSALIAAPLLTTAGVLNSTPMIVILPDDKRLGEFHDEFHAVLGTFAENPKDDTEEELIFAGADKVVKLYKVFDELEDDNDNQVDARAYLKARLMDIFLGDWDRHVGQWKWARFETDDRKIWQPIPRDRDQAFARYDGIFPRIATYAVPQIESFDDHYPQINDLTWSGRHMDRRFLSGLDRSAWDSVSADLQKKLTDEVIINAVNNMPPEWVAQEGEFLTGTLMERRNRLSMVARDFYEYMAYCVSVYGSDKREYAEITRYDNGVTVSIYKKDKQTGQKKGHPFYYRRFDSEDTDEIRIYLQGGDDTAIISGETENGMIVRVIGGGGADSLIDHSLVRGYFLSLKHLPFYRTSSFLYDHGNKTSFVTGPSTYVDQNNPPEVKEYQEGDNVNEKYEPQTEDRDYDWKPAARFNYNSNDGLTLGGGPILIRHDFRKTPYRYRMSLLGAYVTNLDAFVVDFDSRFIFSGIRSLDIVMRRALGYSSFYGYGNATEIPESLDESDFYRVRFNLTELRANYVLTPAAGQEYWFGISLNIGETTGDSGTILDSLQLANTHKRNYYGLHFGLRLDARDHELAPFSGHYVDLVSFNYPRFLVNRHWYHKVKLDARKYFSFDLLSASTIGVRINLEKLWGDYPLHESAFLGGQKNLRGYGRERFAGHALAYAGMELRSTLFPVRVLVPARFGFSALVETGRVFYDSAEPDQWHPVWGGGLWLSFLNRLFTVNTTLALSETDTQFYITTGFMF